MKAVCRPSLRLLSVPVQVLAEAPSVRLVGVPVVAEPSQDLPWLCSRRRTRSLPSLFRLPSFLPPPRTNRKWLQHYHHPLVETVHFCVGLTVLLLVACCTEAALFIAEDPLYGPQLFLCDAQGLSPSLFF